MTRLEPITGLELPSYIAGKPETSGAPCEVHYPYTGAISGTVAQCGQNEVERAIAAALRESERPDRWARHEILDNARRLLDA